ncbi:unnamed protein product [Amoebophrya sp. A120]|nr:unnamed protein product [Amoebophrya sp. A120]|eukprot:GSA120T00014895001.1
MLTPFVSHLPPITPPLARSRPQNNSSNSTISATSHDNCHSTQDTDQSRTISDADITQFHDETHTSGQLQEARSGQQSESDNNQHDTSSKNAVDTRASGASLKTTSSRSSCTRRIDSSAAPDVENQNSNVVEVVERHRHQREVVLVSGSNSTADEQENENCTYDGQSQSRATRRVCSASADEDESSTTNIRGGGRRVAGPRQDTINHASTSTRAAHVARLAAAAHHENNELFAARHDKLCLFFATLVTYFGTLYAQVILRTTSVILAGTCRFNCFDFLLCSPFLIRLVHCGLVYCMVYLVLLITVVCSFFKFAVLQRRSEAIGICTMVTNFYTCGCV